MGVREIYQGVLSKQGGFFISTKKEAPQIVLSEKLTVNKNLHAADTLNVGLTPSVTPEIHYKGEHLFSVIADDETELLAVRPDGTTRTPKLTVTKAITAPKPSSEGNIYGFSQNSGETAIFGINNVLNGYSENYNFKSMILGNDNTLTNLQSYIVGYSNHTNGPQSFAFGNNNTIPQDSYAIGCNNTIAGGYSNIVVMGRNNDVVSGFINVFGSGLQAEQNTNTCHTIIGSYNEKLLGSETFVIGNGTEAARRTGLYIDKNNLTHLEVPDEPDNEKSPINASYVNKKGTVEPLFSFTVDLKQMEQIASSKEPVRIAELPPECEEKTIIISPYGGDWYDCSLRSYFIPPNGANRLTYTPAGASDAVWLSVHRENSSLFITGAETLFSS